MPAYVIFQGEVTDAGRYELYKPEALASIEAAGGRYVVRGGSTELLEGTAPSRTVVVEFADVATARDWYFGESYTRARKLREGAARTEHMFIIEGGVG